MSLRSFSIVEVKKVTLHANPDSAISSRTRSKVKMQKNNLVNKSNPNNTPKNDKPKEAPGSSSNISTDDRNLIQNINVEHILNVCTLWSNRNLLATYFSTLNSLVKLRRTVSIKNRRKWSTKYHFDKLLSVIYFCLHFIQNKMLLLLLCISEYRNWNSQRHECTSNKIGDSHKHHNTQREQNLNEKNFT